MRRREREKSAQHTTHRTTDPPSAQREPIGDARGSGAEGRRPWHPGSSPSCPRAAPSRQRCRRSRSPEAARRQCRNGQGGSYGTRPGSAMGPSPGADAAEKTRAGVPIQHGSITARGSLAGSRACGRPSPVRMQLGRDGWGVTWSPRSWGWGKATEPQSRCGYRSGVGGLSGPSAECAKPEGNSEPGPQASAPQCPVPAECA